jgi:CRP-like cAMP-binding protein
LSNTAFLPSKPSGNRLLDALSPTSRDAILADAVLEHHQIRQVLIEEQRPVPFVFFVTSGMISLVTSMSDGASVEMGTVGREGVVGLPTAMDEGAISGSLAICQAEAGALKMTASAFRSKVERNGELADRVAEYTNALFLLVGRNAGCNRLHAVEQRMSRWLLMTHDRVGVDRFPLTQEFLSQMIGARRPWVTDIAKRLRSTGSIDYRRGWVSILDRAALESASCECYEVVAAAFADLYGVNGHRGR